MADDVVVITGPTASGKTALAIEVARRIDGEVISMDSRQVYRGMDIGTAKPPMHERGGVPHHGFDVVAPDERFNAGRFARLARTWMADIAARGHVPIVAGGTGFFLRALTHPLFEEPALDDARKEALKRFLADVADDTLREWAEALEPGAPLPVDRQRLSRIVEVALLTGRPLSSWHRSAAPGVAALEPLTFVLDVPADVLRARIEARVDDMIRAGLVDEVWGLMARGFSERDPGMNATGYIEMVPHIRGERSLEEAAELVKA
ncbi:MAG TPA: tRNA (adenosine(37)-N6)-dimethylallyltransferase MiaA, partial [Longimicrobiales bacterium]|nr:tRNA (adenosine(37)-N6)-dimethylallyltransferase MiaA [Longimicrobiales bacterium]